MDLVRKLKTKSYRKISIVEILKKDLSNENDSKRMGMNIQLKNLCQKNEIEFLEIDIDKKSMLDRRGLHLRALPCRRPIFSCEPRVGGLTVGQCRLPELVKCHIIVPRNVQE